MCLPVIFRVPAYRFGISPAQDYAFASLIEDLSNACLDALRIQTAEKAYAYEARFRICVANKSPRDSSRLVIKGRMEIPGSGRGVLDLACRSIACSGLRVFDVCPGPDHLNRFSKTQPFCFQQVVEIHNRRAL